MANRWTPVVPLLLFLVLNCAVSCTRSDGMLLRLRRELNESCARVEPPTVCIDDGCLRGTFMDGFQSDRGQFEAFLGIPFARPPVGALRFADPVPNEPWANGDPTPYNATTAKDMCVQRNDLIPNAQVTGSEDCLYLNVYRPLGQNANKAPLPVMVYIHGGGFFSGSAHPSVVGPEYFLDTGRVILVTVQYRLAALGFLSTGTADAPGNYALKDQTMALRWVRQNIRQFGGDDRLTTIFGQSAGAGSVHMHMLSPLSRGLFDRVIVMSGSSLAPWNIPTADPLRLAREQARVLNIADYADLPTGELVQRLREIPAEELVASIGQLKAWSVDPLTLYRPVIEAVDSKNAFLTEDPRFSWQRGNYRQVPWMTGVVPNEGAVRALAIVTNKQLLDELNANVSTVLPILLERPPTDTLVKTIRSRFFNNTAEGEPLITPDNVQAFIDLYTEAAFLYPTQHGVKQYITHADTELAPVSLYKFSYRGRYSYSAFYAFNQNDYGVVHCDDLIYLFRSPALFPDFPVGAPELDVSRLLVNFYIDFAINGRATALKSYRKCEDRNQVSQSMDCDVLEFFNAGTAVDVRVISGHNEELFAFWKDFY